MNKIVILFGIMMFSITVMADGPQYGFLSRPESNYSGNYNSGYGRRYQSQSQVSSTQWNANDNWLGASSGNQTIYGGTVGKFYSTTGDNDGENSGEYGGNRQTGGLLSSGDTITPVGDAIIPLSIMSLLFAGFLFLKKSKGGSL